MKFALKASASALVLATFLATGASAADVYGRGESTKDAPEYHEGRVVNWSGLYVGAQAGYGIGTITGEDSPIGLSFESPVLSAIAGYDIARGRFLVGAFGEYTYITDDLADDISDWAVGIRAGVVVAPRTLIYGSIAYAQLSADGSEDAVDGLRVGLGTEFALTNNLFVDTKVNYTWYDLEDANSYADAGDLRALVGLKLKLNSGLGF